MKCLLVLLACLSAPFHLQAQANEPTNNVQAPAYPCGILQSIENAEISPAGDHYLVTARNRELPVQMLFRSGRGVGINRDQAEWWVLPINAASKPIVVNTNLWVLPDDPASRDNSWYIKLHDTGSIAADFVDGLRVNVTAAHFELYRSETRPHSDTFNHRFTLNIEGGDLLENALANFYWGTMLPSVVERTQAKNFPYSDGYVLSTLRPNSYAGSYPAVDHEFQIKGRLAMGSDVDLDIVKRMIELEFKLMNDDPEGLHRIPCSVQPDGRREYHVRRNSLDDKHNAQMFPVTGNIEVLEESWRYYEAVKDKEWLAKNIGNLENAASWTIAHIDQYGRLWGDVYYEDQVIKDGRATQSQAFAAYTFGLLAGMENLLGRGDKSATYNALSKKLAAALVKPLPQGYWDDESLRFVDWVDRLSKVHDHIHLLANELPLTFGYASEAQTSAVLKLLAANLDSFEKFPSFVAADIAAYDKSEIGTGGPYDLCAAGRYWYWDANFWASRKNKDLLFRQLTTVATEAAKDGYFMGERYDMDDVYYIDGKDWHGASMYYEYPNVYAAVLISKILGINKAADVDIALTPQIKVFGTVEVTAPQYDLKYTFDASGFTLKNLSDKKRSFRVDLSSLEPGDAKYQVSGRNAGKSVGTVSKIDLAGNEEVHWIRAKQ